MDYTNNSEFSITMAPLFRVWRKDPRAVLPTQAHPTDVGWDICNLYVEEFLVSGEYRAIRTGLVVQPPDGYYIEVVPRSSLFKRHGLLLANSVGIVDPTYCGEDDELHVLVWATKTTTIPAGTRIAQIIPRHRIQIAMEDMTGTAFPSPNRGGIGSTGA